ncbi:Protein of unknown function, partial [Cotesia congregata]
YHSKKARVLTLSQVNKFLNDSDDLNNLANKVILTFGVLGALRTSEICNLNIQDVEDTGSQMIATINDNKNCYPLPSATITNKAPSTSTANQNNPKTNLNDDDVPVENFLQPDSDDDLFFEAYLDDDFDSNINLNPSAITETDDHVPKSTEIISTPEHKSVPKVDSTQKRKLNEIRKTACAESFKKLKKFQGDSKPSVRKN